MKTNHYELVIFPISYGFQIHRSCLVSQDLEITNAKMYTGKILTKTLACHSPAKLVNPPPLPKG